MREQDLKVLCTKPYVYCNVFEDNSGALELARLPKLCPRTVTPILNNARLYITGAGEYLEPGLFILDSWGFIVYNFLL